MGSSKALLPFDNEPLIRSHRTRVEPPLRRDCRGRRAGARDASLTVKLVRDEVAYQGPVGGIYYGLKAAGGEFSFVTSCDVALCRTACEFISTTGFPNWPGP